MADDAREVDREAAATLAEAMEDAVAIGGNDLAAIRSGFWDEPNDDVLSEFVQAFAAHRQSTISRLSEPDDAMVEKVARELVVAEDLKPDQIHYGYARWRHKIKAAKAALSAAAKVIEG